MSASWTQSRRSTAKAGFARQSDGLELLRQATGLKDHDAAYALSRVGLAPEETAQEPLFGEEDGEGDEEAISQQLVSHLHTVSGVKLCYG